MDDLGIFRPEALQARRERLKSWAVEPMAFNGRRWLFAIMTLLLAIAAFAVWIPMQSNIRIDVLAKYEAGQWKIRVNRSATERWISIDAAERGCEARLIHGQSESYNTNGYVLTAVNRQTLWRRLADRAPAQVYAAEVVRCLEALP